MTLYTFEFTYYVYNPARTEQNQQVIIPSQTRAEANKVMGKYYTLLNEKYGEIQVKFQNKIRIKSNQVIRIKPFSIETTILH